MITIQNILENKCIMLISTESNGKLPLSFLIEISYTDLTLIDIQLHLKKQMI